MDPVQRNEEPGASTPPRLMGAAHNEQQYKRGYNVHNNWLYPNTNQFHNAQTITDQNAIDLVRTQAGIIPVNHRGLELDVRLAGDVFRAPYPSKRCHSYHGIRPYPPPTRGYNSSEYDSPTTRSWTVTANDSGNINIPPAHMNHMNIQPAHMNIQPAHINIQPAHSSYDIYGPSTSSSAMGYLGTAQSSYEDPQNNIDAMTNNDGSYNSDEDSVEIIDNEMNRSDLTNAAETDGRINCTAEQNPAVVEELNCEDQEVLVIQEEERVAVEEPVGFEEEEENQEFLMELDDMNDIATEKELRELGDDELALRLYVEAEEAKKKYLHAQAQWEKYRAGKYPRVFKTLNGKPGFIVPIPNRQTRHQEAIPSTSTHPSTENSNEDYVYENTDAVSDTDEGPNNDQKADGSSEVDDEEFVVRSPELVPAPVEVSNTEQEAYDNNESSEYMEIYEAARRNIL